MIERAGRGPVAHRAHARVKFKAAVLDSASLEVNHESLIAHDVAVRASYDGDLRCIAHLAPREGTDRRGTSDLHGLPAVTSDRIALNDSLGKNWVVTLLALARTANAAIHVDEVAKADHGKVGPGVGHRGTCLPLRGERFSRPIFVRSPESSLEVGGQVKAPHGILPAPRVSFSASGHKFPSVILAPDNHGLVHEARRRQSGKLVQHVADVALYGIFGDHVKAQGKDLVRGRSQVESTYNDRLAKVRAVLLIIDHDDTGVFRYRDGFILDIADLPAALLLEVV